jgi:hypothetical protein
LGNWEFVLTSGPSAVCGFIFALKTLISLERRKYVSKTARKEEIALERGVIVQHVDGPGYQVRAIMEATGVVKDAPVIRELLDEALGARRRKALGITDSEEPPGQETAETLHTIRLFCSGSLSGQRCRFAARISQLADFLSRCEVNGSKRREHETADPSLPGKQRELWGS